MDLFFDVYKNGKKKNCNPLGVKMSWVEMTQVIRVPHVTCFDPFFVEQPVNSRLDHIRHHERPVPLGLQLALLVEMMNENYVAWIYVLSQNFLVSPGLCFFMVFVEV